MLDDILLFVSLVESGNFKKTAELMSIQTSTVSKHIANLERKLGKTLLIRDTRNITITEYGEFIYDRFKHLPLYITDTLNTNSISQINFQSHEGVLNVCLGSAISYEFITPQLDHFIQLYPKVKLNINFSTNFTQFHSKDTDIMLSPTYIKGKNLENRFLRTEYGKLFCSNKYADKYGIPLTVEDLNSHRIIGALDINNQVIDYVTMNNINTKEIYMLNLKSSSIKVNNPLHIKKIGVNADYIFGSWESLCCSDLKNGTIIAILPEWIAYKIDFYLVSRKRTTLIEQLFIDFISNCMRK